MDNLKLEGSLFPVYTNWYYTVDLPETILAPVLQDTKDMLAVNFQGHTANPSASLSHEYFLKGNSEAAIENLVRSLVLNPDDSKTIYELCQNTSFQKELWINFQQKNESVPLGALSTESDASFIIFLQAQEQNSTTPDLQFIYPDHTSPFGINTIDLKLDNSFVNKMIVFPSNLAFQISSFKPIDSTAIFRSFITGNIKASSNVRD